MNYLFLILTFFLTINAVFAHAQDTLYVIGKIPVAVSNIVLKKEFVQFQMFGQPAGQTLIEYNKDIEKIVYRGGKTVFFNAVPNDNQTGNNTSPPSIVVKDKIWHNVIHLSYLLIPTSFSHGAELHLDFPVRSKPGKIAYPSFGFGGAVILKRDYRHTFTNYEATLNIRRYSGHFTTGLRLTSKQLSLYLRMGYNYMRGEFDYTSVDGCLDCGLLIKQNYHRLMYEAVLLKSFSTNKPGIGLFVGVQYMHQPRAPENTEGDIDSKRLLILKTGLAF